MPKPNLPFEAAVERRTAGPVPASRRIERVLWAHAIARSKSPKGRVAQGETAPPWRTIVRKSGIES